MNDLPLSNRDESIDTYVKIGCYRELGRLDRVLRVFRVAMALAEKDGADVEFQHALVSVLDHKGILYVHWKSGLDQKRFRTYIDRAWDDESEVSVAHGTDEDDEDGDRRHWDIQDTMLETT